VFGGVVLAQSVKNYRQDFRAIIFLVVSMLFLSSFIKTREYVWHCPLTLEWLKPPPIVAEFEKVPFGIEYSQNQG